MFALKPVLVISDLRESNKTETKKQRKSSQETRWAGWVEWEGGPKERRHMYTHS